MDQVIVVKMLKIAVISISFDMKNRQFVQLCYI